jgi:hypothetical protein
VIRHTGHLPVATTWHNALTPEAIEAANCALLAYSPSP